MFVGSPQELADKIIGLVNHLQLNRFMLHLPIGSMPHKKTLEAIRLFGKETAPIVRQHFESVSKSK
ncbi:hypothetical protein A0O21_04415 [Streptococcus pantholopis]|uniref:Luciferase-like domain-containing protein n=1 Tax=Streptococcus pantholopis TaxID=1811193 RepID=A0A172Q786_9STRE|nr:hypothetical protein A0O21_04415 [Streptococcus pantholopis]